ncbi:MAG: protein kinase [Planctomycetota bacterium]|nr:protein kinase [Planctomycetota bacterium]
MGKESSAHSSGYLLLACPKCSAGYKVRRDRAEETVSCRRCGHAWVPSHAAAGAAPDTSGPEPAPPKAAPAPRIPPAAEAPPAPRREEQEDKTDPLVGANLNGFKILSRIGSGGFGVVYRAFDTDLERSVAIKMLPANIVKAGPKVLDRFLREARSAAKLSHPNIVTIHQICRYRDTFYIVMELVDGGALHEFLAVERRFKPAEATRIIRAAAEGLGHAHRRGVIHRDIKPGNIMMTNDGHVKVSDFGLARDVLQASDIVGEGHSLGTPRYMAPEQTVGDQPTASSDLYSLAATYFILLTGRSPFEASSDREMMKKHLNAPLPDPRQYAPDLPIAVYRFLQKAMAKDPEERYQTAEEFIAALDRLEFSALAADVAPTPATLSAQIGPITLEDRGSHLSKALGRAVRRAQRHHATPSPARYPADLPSKEALRLGGWKLWLLIGVLAAAVIVVAVVVAFLLTPHAGPEGVTPAPGQGTAPSPPGTGLVQPAPPAGSPVAPAVPLEVNARIQLDAVKEFEKHAGNDPFQRLAVIQSYQDVIKFYPGTQAAEEARQAIERLRKKEGEGSPPAAPETPEKAPAE